MSPILKLQAASVALDPDDVYPLHITAKRYTLPALEAPEDVPGALTLILLHSTGFHKEIWEPTLQELFSFLTLRSGTPGALVREAWSIECPNHGESAVLNETALLLPDNHNNFTCEKYATAVHRFLLAGPSKGAKVDFKSRNLVGIGHSLGGVAMTILQQLSPKIPFQTVILVEPMLSPKGSACLQNLRVDLVRSAYERRDVWSNRQQALEALKQRGRTRKWDPRVLDVFVTYALRTHPGARFTDTPYNGVNLCCSRDEEAAMYRDVDGPTKPVLDLNEACQRLPIHVIFGDDVDYIPREVQDALVDPASPRRFASVSRIGNSGHLVPHQAPAALAKAFVDILGGRDSESNTKKSGWSSKIAKL
ncbi:Alpha/beta hydrolase fold-1 [Phellopilus nigrolimitatus]|nr:Alpha/beta hydrolase fold-1 [Phellopilus nigrolimitatus]